jgi:hypothetical protein
MYDDEDEDREGVLKKLSGDVDDYAASQLEDPDAKSKSTTISITITPADQGPSDKGPEDEENAGGEDAESKLMQESDEPHDPIAHILGMCGGGCTGK